MHRLMRNLIACLVAVVVAAGAPRAFADDSATAKARYTSGTKHFDLGEFQQALEDFKEGYRIKDDPVFLYNIAQCYRIMKDHVEALRFYRSYLRRAPDAPNRAEVEAKIATLSQAIETEERATKMPPNQVLPESGRGTAPTGTTAGTAPTGSATGTAPTGTATATATADATVTRPAPAASTPVYKKWWFWTLIGGAAVVALGVGLGVGLSSSSSGPGTLPAVTF